jgi:SulP family sulfate permease
MKMKQPLTAQAKINQLRSQLLQEFQLNRLLPSLPAGIIIGMIVILVEISFPDMVALPQDSPAAILTLMATAIAGSMSASKTPENLFFTVVAAIVITSLLTGVCSLALGIFKLGGLIRFIPYPVVGGFLAGTGWLLVKGAIEVMTEISLSFSTLPSLFQFDHEHDFLAVKCGRN